MTTSQKPTLQRKPLFQGLDDVALAIDEGRKPVDLAQIDAVAAANDFPSRQPPKQHEAIKVATIVATGKLPDIQERKRRRYTTGRNVQLNIKAKQSTIDTMNQLADRFEVPLGEILERALAALVNSTFDVPGAENE